MKKLLLLPILFLSLNGFTQDIKIDTINVLKLNPVTIIGEKTKILPGSGQIVNQQQLERMNQSNINNVLRVIPGVNVRDEEGFGLRPNIGLRGTSVNRSSKITLMEDGILIAPAPYSDPSAYYFPTFARMQGIEVLKGSSQIKYGPYTIGGAINLISTAIPNQFKGFGQISYGSFGTNQQRFWVGDSKKNFDYVFDINRLASNGFKQLDNGGNTGFDRRDMMGKLRWHNDKNSKRPQSVTLKFVNTTEIGNESYLGLTYQDYQKNHLRRYAATQKDKLDMNHNHLTLNHSMILSDGLLINTTAYYSKTFRDWGRVNSVAGQSLNNILNDPTTHQTPYNIMTGQVNGSLDYQSAARTYYSKGVQTNLTYFFNTKSLLHQFNVGLRYHEDQADRYATRSTYNMSNGNMILASVGVYGNQENQIRNAKSFSGFINYDLKYKNLKITPGVRYENIAFDFQNYGNNDNARIGADLKSASNQLEVILPGIGFNYGLNKSMTFFGGVHKGFSPPGMPSIGNSTAQAKIETSMNYEIGYRIENKVINAQMVGFLNNYDNILGSDNVSGGGAGTGDMFNAGHAKIQGIELSLSYNVLHHIKNIKTFKMPLIIAYTYNDAKFEETFVNGGGDWGSRTINKGDLIPFITPHLLTASLGFENKNLNISITGRYTGDTRINPSHSSLITPSENVSYTDFNSIAGFLILDCSANYKINQYFTAFTTINNLTNNKAITTNLPQGFRPNMPLSFNAGFKIDF